VRPGSSRASKSSLATDAVLGSGAVRRGHGDGSFFAFHTLHFIRSGVLRGPQRCARFDYRAPSSCCAKCPRGRDKCPGRENVLQSVEDGHGLHARLRRGRKLADDRCALVTFAHAAWTMCGPTRRRWRSCNNVVAGATRGCGVLASAQHHLLT
jgi:hypothetical protein